MLNIEKLVGGGRHSWCGWKDLCCGLALKKDGRILGAP